MADDYELLRHFFLEAFPNPERIGCPEESVIRSIADNSLPITDPARLHLAECSECYAEFRGFKIELEGKKLVSTIESVALALLAKSATVSSVAAALGKIASRRSIGFVVRPSDPHLCDVLIGTSGSQPASAIPDYVQMAFDPNYKMHIDRLNTLGDDWRAVPNVPGSSPFLYGCRANGSTSELSVSIIATLSDDPQRLVSSVVELTLQRADWSISSASSN